MMMMEEKKMRTCKTADDHDGHGTTDVSVAHPHVHVAGTTAYADRDGTVYAFDSVAGHYSLHHGLTARQQQIVRRLAAHA